MKIKDIERRIIELNDLSQEGTLPPEQIAELKSLSNQYDEYHLGEKDKKDLEFLKFLYSRRDD